MIIIAVVLREDKDHTERNIVVVVDNNSSSSSSRFGKRVNIFCFERPHHAMLSRTCFMNALGRGRNAAAVRAFSAAAGGDKLLFTPGPLTTSLSVKEAMLHDLSSSSFSCS